MVLGASTPVSMGDVCVSSGEAKRGSMFVCIRGTRLDGAAYLEEVWQKGCRCVVIDRRSCLKCLKDICPDVMNKACIVLVADCRTAYGLLCRNLFKRPDERLCMIGITGTKGKTSTASFLYQMLMEAGIRAGQIGTCGAIWGANQEDVLCTTPDPHVLYDILNRMVCDGITHVVMEVSSQALKQKRVSGITFAVGVFTNLFPDHISSTEHGDMEEYFYWKSRLFYQCKTAVLADPEEVFAAGRLYNLVKDQMPVFLVTSAYKTCVPDSRYLCSLTAPVEYIRYYHKPAQRLSLRLWGGKKFKQLLVMPGSFQVTNYLFALTIVIALGLPVKENLKLKPVTGRMECVAVCDGACFYVDYAHNAQALKEALLSLKKFEPNQLICVFGCGGNRSRVRRGPMGHVSSTFADLTILTEDNSRDEEFSDICQDILAGVEEGHNTVQVIENRSLAIQQAVELAKPGDIVIVAGKGHENYMEKNGKRTWFSDGEEVRKYVRLRKHHH